MAQKVQSEVHEQRGADAMSEDGFYIGPFNINCQHYFCSVYPLSDSTSVQFERSPVEKTVIQSPAAVMVEGLCQKVHMAQQETGYLSAL